MICDNCIHNAVCERLHFENHCGYKHTEADIIIPELEKIKAEIGDKFVDLQDGTEEWRSVWNDAIEECYRSLDKHISEMKGEAK